MEYMDYHFLDLVKSLYNLLSEKGKATTCGRQVAETIAYRERTDIGKTAANFSFVDQSGKRKNIYDIKGKVKLLFFWNSLVPISHRENTAISEYYKKFHDKGLEVISISLNQDKVRWAEIAKEDNLAWIQGIARGKDNENVEYLYRIQNSYPTTYILDENNKIIAKRLRREQIENKLAELLP